MRCDRPVAPNIMENQMNEESLAHTKWNCKYNMVFCDYWVICLQLWNHSFYLMERKMKDFSDKYVESIIKKEMSGSIPES